MASTCGSTERNRTVRVVADPHEVRMRLVVACERDAGPRPQVLGPSDPSVASQAENCAIRSGRLVSQSHGAGLPGLPSTSAITSSRRNSKVTAADSAVAHVGDEDQAGQAVEPGLVGP